MAIFRQYIAPLIVVLMFVFALVVVSARIFLPADMAAPAPIESEQVGQASGTTLAGSPSSLDVLIHGLPDDFGFMAAPHS